MNQVINIKQPKEINLRSDSPSLSSMSRPGASITTVSPDKELIPRKIKRKKFSETFIKGKETIQVPDNPSKRSKEDSIIDEIIIIIKTPPPFQNKEDYIGGTHEKTCQSDDYPSDTDGCARNLGDEHKNEENDEYIEPPSENDRRK